MHNEKGARCIPISAGFDSITRSGKSVSCSNETISTGAATVVTQLYESPCTILGWDSGTIAKKMTANCCGPSAVLRINGNDWNQLIEQGKLDGLRYIRVSKNTQGTYQIEPRKVTTGAQPVTISGGDFFK